MVSCQNAGSPLGFDLGYAWKWELYSRVRDHVAYIYTGRGSKERIVAAAHTSMEAVGRLGPEFTITSVLAYAASELLRSRDSSREGQEFRCASGAGATRKVRRARVSTLFCGCRLGWVWQCGPGSVATHNSAVWDSRLASFRQACAAGLRPNRRRLGRLRRRRRWQLADQQQQRRERQHRRGRPPSKFE